MIINKYQNEARPREITINVPTPGTHMHPMAIPSLIHHANDMDKDCATMIYSQTPNEFGEDIQIPNMLGEAAVKHFKECDSYQAPITRLLFTTYSNSDKASYQRYRSTVKTMGRDGFLNHCIDIKDGFLNNCTDTGDGLL
jgi:hypothetical protein